MAGEAAVSGGASAPAAAPPAAGAEVPVKGVPGVMKRTPTVEHKGAPPSAKVQANTADAKPPPAAGTEAKPDWPRTIRHVIDGKKIEQVVNNWEEFEDFSQRIAAENLRHRSRQNEVERAWKVLDDAKKNPAKRAQIIKEMFPDFDPRTETIEQLKREFELEQMDPKDRELAMMKEQLAEYEREKTRAEEQRKQQEEAALNAAADAEVEQEILAAIEELRPHFDPEFLGEASMYVIDVLRDAAARGETLSAKQAALRVRRLEEQRESRIEKRRGEKFKSLRGQELIAHLESIDPKLVDEVVKAHLDRTAPRDVPLTQAKPPEPKAPEVKGDDDERALTMGINYGRAPRMGFR